MEEQKFSSEQPEEVIELLDIVGDSVAEDDVTQVGQGVSGAGDGASASDDETVPEEAASDEVVLLQENAVVSESDAAAAEESRPSEEEVDAVRPVEMTETASSEVAEKTEDAGLEPDERLTEPEKKHEAEVAALEARIAALEKANAELAENVESLSQQIAQAGTMFMEDASVRLNMEEMVSRMLDARLPATEEQEESSGENDMASRVAALEARMREWEEQSEHRAALAAARVIREEIAAMRAEATGNAR